MAPSHRRRFALGTALGAALAVWLLHGFVSDARRQVARETLVRRAVVAAQAAAELLSREPGRLPEWKAGSAEVESALWVRGMQLESSTLPGESAPRRLQREEKPLFDRAQRIASAVQTNRDEGARKFEIEVEDAGGRLLVAAPVEAGGMVQILTRPLPPPPKAAWAAFFLALFTALAAVAAAAKLIGERRAILALVSIGCLAAPLGVLIRREVAEVRGERRVEAASVVARVHEQKALLTFGSPERWDADAFGRPRGEVRSDGSVDDAVVEAAASTSAGELGRALWTALFLALAMQLLAGFGAFSRIGSAVKRNRQAYLYIAPAILGMLLLVLYPFAYGITLSFTDQNLYNTNRPLAELWIGLRNYGDILGDFAVVRRGEGGFAINYLNFYWTLIVTVIWTVTNVAIGVSSGLVLALILNTRDLLFKPIYRVLLILPWAVPNYITALIWKGMFHQQFGVINHFLRMVGLPAVNWFDRPLTSFLTALATNGWLSFPFMMVISLGALQSIPADLYEAARVEGASRWQQFRAITLPSLRPALIPAVIISVVWTFNMFNIIYLVTGGEPGGATEILVTQAYKYAFERYRYGYAAAYSTVIFGILLVYGLIQNRVSKATEGG